jgi:hypothetical protein
MENLNLDVDSYSDQELMKLFSLSNDFSADAVRASGKRLISQVNATKLTSEKKQSIDLFVSSCVQRLVGYANSGHKDPNAGTWSQKYNNMVTGTDHQIIEKSRSYVSKQQPIFQGTVPAGYLNPFAITSLTKGINIDSRFRKNYFTTTASDFVFHLPSPLRKVHSMTVSATDIPLSAYAISQKRGDNVFLISDESSTVTLSGYGTSYINGNKSTVDLATNNNLYEAWLIIIPDGLYEQSWQSQSEASPLDTIINNSIALAKTGVIDNETGIFYSELSGITVNALDPSIDIAYISDRISGRSILSYPTTPGQPYSGKFTAGFNVHFAIDKYGNRDLVDSIQLKLGWKLGYRTGNYKAAEYDSSTNANNVMSEGVCLVTPPRYVFISIDDGQKASNNNYSVIFTDSSLDVDIIARINYAAEVNNSGAYLIASDVGLSNSMNRTREYFGPVDIDKLRIRLLDEYGRILDLNHMDWSMTLSFNILHE